MLEAVASAVLVFALYRYISGALGIDQLGVWSAVLATVSAARLADLGLSAGVTRFVAREHARGEPERAEEVIDTATLTLMVTVGVLLALLYPLMEELLPHLFELIYFRHRIEGVSPRRLRETPREHQAILDAIAERDAAKAKRLMRRHMHAGRAATMQAIRAASRSFAL